MVRAKHCSSAKSAYVQVSTTAKAPDRAQVRRTRRNSTTAVGQTGSSSFGLIATGSPTYSIAGNPAWVTLNTSSGALTFTNPPVPAANQTQSFNFTVGATNATGSTSQTFTVYDLPAFGSASAFTAGDILVERVGDAGTTYGAQGSSPTSADGVSGGIFVDEYKPDGTFVQTVFISTAFSESLSATSASRSSPAAGSATMMRSRRLFRPVAMSPSSVPGLGYPLTADGARPSSRSSNTPQMRMSASSSASRRLRTSWAMSLAP